MSLQLSFQWIAADWVSLQENVEANIQIKQSDASTSIRGNFIECFIFIFIWMDNVKDVRKIGMLDIEFLYTHSHTNTLKWAPNFKDVQFKYAV